MRRILQLAALLVLASLPVWAADYVLIAHPDLAGVNMTQGDVRQVFLGIKTQVGGRPVEPVLARSGIAHQQFAAVCLGKTETGLTNYFRMQLFSGKGTIPKSFASAAEIVAYVAKTPGAIGYVGHEASLTGVVVVDPK